MGVPYGRAERGRWAASVGIILFAAVSAGFGQGPDIYDPDPVAVLGIASADAAFLQAIAHGSTAGVENLLDTEVTWTDAGGRVQSKAQVLRGIPKPVITTNLKDAETRTYAYQSLGNIQENLGRAHVLRVWVKRPEGWKLIVYQEVMSRDTP